jgi:hypothetical protein
VCGYIANPFVGLTSRSKIKTEDTSRCWVSIETDLSDMDPSNIDRLLHLYSESSASERETLDFWSAEIRKYCLKNNTVVFTVQQLTKAHTVNDIYPSSCEIAVKLLKEKRVGVESKFELLADEVDVLSSLLSSVTLWSRTSSENEQLVCTSLVSTVSERLLDRVSLLDDRSLVVFVGSERSCPAEFTFPGLVRGQLKHASLKSSSDGVDAVLSQLSDDEVRIILKHMVKKKVAVLSEDGKVVKLLRGKSIQAPTNSLVSSIWGTISTAIGAAPPAATESVSEADLASLYLRRSIQQIEERVESLRRSSADLLHKAKVMKVMAVTDWYTCSCTDGAAFLLCLQTATV